MKKKPSKQQPIRPVTPAELERARGGLPPGLPKSEEEEETTQL